MKKQRKQGILHGLLCMAAMCVLGTFIGMGAKAGTLTESPYVSFSPDGTAWTVAEPLEDAKHSTYYGKNGIIPPFWYPRGERVETGIASTLRALGVGEHYYATERTGEVPVGYWKVSNERAACIHDCFEPQWCGVPNVGPDGNGGKCGYGYYSGWFAYCADCGDMISPVLMYMSKETVSSITYINKNFGYYYTCPSCAHIENTLDAGPHECKAISFNQYKVVYDKNEEVAFEVNGYMEDSLHMYNNADMYEGEKITPITRLSKNVYTRSGYVFTGWNTKPDGSGTAYEDCAEIFNLSVYDWNIDPEQGTVTLYAQWETAESTLILDLQGGSYQDAALAAQGGVYNSQNHTVTLTKKYRETYHADPAKVTAPAGYKVSFHTNGGNAISPVSAGTVFLGWQLPTPLNGRIRDNVYAFLGPDGSTDRLTALYEPGAITLPTPTWAGHSFGGWFSDKDCTKPVGFGGEKFTPKADTTLYAKWATLVLHSKENYTDNDKKGAVDLSWSQPDNQDKSYKLYMAEGNGAFSLLYGAKETTNKNDTEKSFAYTGTQTTYTVPYSGFYELSASGAQGGAYGSYAGGKGGKATAKIYLTAGEKLTVTVGGKNGYNGGGKATKYGNGGGATTIVSNLQGTLVVAGGGGGAGANGAGNDGGAEDSLRADNKSTGAEGHSGGGGGAIGGNAGVLVIHSHDDDTCFKDVPQDYNFTNFASYTTVTKDDMYGTEAGNAIKKVIDTNGVNVRGHTNGSNSHFNITIGNASGLIPTNGNTSLEIPLYFYSWSGNGYIEDDGYMAVYNQNGTTLASFKLADYTEFHQGGTKSYYITSDRYAEAPKTFSVTLPANTTGIYLSVYVPIHNSSSGGGSWADVKIGQLRFTGGVQQLKLCSYEEGDVISSLPAYGGSNYIHGAATYAEKKRGIQTGNGAAYVKAVSVGYLNELSLKGVAAPDKAAPDKISVNEGDLILQAEGDNAVQVTFQKPKDGGTTYRYKAESYTVKTDTLLCTSNITSETLTTGVKGYYYKLDTTPKQTVTATNADNKGRLLVATGDTQTVKVILSEDVMYLHVAAVDVAGNVGATSDIPIKREEMAWDIGTGQIEISDQINEKDYHTVYPKDANTYYVRADGKTSFLLSFPSYLKGEAREDYQIDYQIFDVKTGAKHQRYSTRIPYSIPITSEASLQVSDFIREMTGESLLKDAMNTTASRKGNGTENAFSQAFTLSDAYHGQTLTVTPVAGATRNESGAHRGEIVYSDWSEDTTHGVTLIADGEAPVIHGAEVLENREYINRNNATVILNLSADDTHSGVKEFYVEITNTDNRSTRVYTPEDGVIKIEITKEEPLFIGDFVVTAYAVDYVGNETELNYGVTEFALHVGVERMLPPHEPLFKRGESGILSIAVWGYADRVEVEFPEVFVQQNPNLNQTYLYTDSPHYKQEETLQFMVPLNASAQEQYQVTVRAYKEGRMLEECPNLAIIVEGSVTEELRTRLR